MLTAPGSYYLTGDSAVRHLISEASRSAVARQKGVFYRTVCAKSYWSTYMVHVPEEEATCLECLAAM